MERLLVLALMLAAVAALPGQSSARQLKAAVLQPWLPEHHAGLTARLAEVVTAAGFAATELDVETLCDTRAMGAGTIDLLVLPDSSALPAKSAGPIEAYLRTGGDVIALDTPLWQQPMIQVDGQWTTAEEVLRRRAVEPPENVIFDFDSSEVTGWTRAGDHVERRALYETVADAGLPGQRALHVQVPLLTSWDTIGPESIESPFPQGHTLTVFAAKGSANTNQLSIEWRETDGSRWIAVVPLTQEWRSYVLRPEDFRFWESVPARRGTRFVPGNAVTAAFGLAFTHTTAVGEGPHEYWIGPFGTAKMTPDQEEVLTSFSPPALEILSPAYKFFESTGVESLSTPLAWEEFPLPIEAGPDTAPSAVGHDDLSQITAAYPVPVRLRSLQPRPRGVGFDKGRAWRWIPLLEATTGQSGATAWRGVPAAMMVHADGPYKGGVWASFAVGDPEWYTNPRVLDLIGAVAKRMTSPIFVLDGGSAYYTYFDDQDIRAGCRVVNVSRQDTATATVRVELLDDAANLLKSEDYELTLKPGEVRSVGYKFKPKRRPSDQESDFFIEVGLHVDGEQLESLSSSFRSWKPRESMHFITAENGHFVHDGKPWKAHGINYMPSSGIGTEEGEYFEHWLGARAYDPEVIQRDLEHIRSLGFNSISVFIYSGYAKDHNLLDLLRRAEELDLKVNLSLRPGTPMNFLWPEIRSIIEHYRLWENDTVFAYDLAWEPTFGSREDRAMWDAEWEKWVIERYGSIEAAEQAWQCPIPRDDAGRVTNPLPHQIDTDGEWRILTAAYRRFLDTLLYSKYGEARRLVRSVDSNHLVSFRMAEAANPTYRWGGRITYDFPYLAAAVDVLEPEAYGRIGEEERLRPAWFQSAYGRWAAPDKPFVWAEAGVTTWDTSRMAESESRLQFAAKAYDLFYDMLIDTGADGIYWWWYPGGFRYGENSDFGIINPDGTDKPVTRVIRKRGPEFLASPQRRPIDHWITFDRDNHPDGISGVYDAAKDEFWQAIASGKQPGLRTAGTGTTSLNCPKDAVGDGSESGGPRKYLDAYFDSVTIIANRETVVPLDEGLATCPPGASVSLEIYLTNLGEATLLARGPGAVSLVTDSRGWQQQVALPADLPRHRSVKIGPVQIEPPDGDTHITLRLMLEDGLEFGDRFAFALRRQ